MAPKNVIRLGGRYTHNTNTGYHIAVMKVSPDGLFCTVKVLCPTDPSMTASTGMVVDNMSVELLLKVYHFDPEGGQ